MSRNRRSISLAEALAKRMLFACSACGCRFVRFPCKSCKEDITAHCPACHEAIVHDLRTEREPEDDYLRWRGRLAERGRGRLAERGRDSEQVDADYHGSLLE